MTIAIYVVSIVLGLISLALFIAAIRHLLGEQTDTVTVMLERYDDRLAAFTHSLQSALDAAQHEAPTLPAAASNPDSAVVDDSDNDVTMLELLEAARTDTSTDAAIAIVLGTPGGPTVATVGLSDDEATEVTRLGLPDLRGAQAVELSFGGDVAGRNGKPPVRAGLSVSLLATPSMLAVLTRSPDRRFSDGDVDALQQLVGVARPSLARSLVIRRPDPVPEPEILTALFDRRSFAALCAREIGEARASQTSLWLLVVDVGRLAEINTRFGQRAGDAVLEEIAQRLQVLAPRTGVVCGLDGGRFAVVLPGAEPHGVDELFSRLRDSLVARAPNEVGGVAVAGGTAELLPADTPATLLERAESALRLAKSAGAGTFVSATPR